MAQCQVHLFATLFLGLMAAATLAQSPYHDCSTNFTTLERALVETSDNRFRILSAFYPSREGVSLYIDVTYNFSCSVNETDDCTEKWIWTCGTLYLIQPPAVSRFTSLLFVFPQGRIKKLKVTLPAECWNVSKIRQGNTEGMLEILTQRLRLYAQYNDLSTIVATDQDPFLAKAVPTSELTNIYGKNGWHHGHYPLAMFFSLTFALPLLTIPTLALVMKSYRVQIRLKLTNQKVHSTFASLIVIGLWFSIFVVIMDILAIANSSSDFGATEDEHASNLTLGLTCATFFLDFSATLYGFLCFHIFCYCGYHGKKINDKCFRFFFRTTFFRYTIENTQEKTMWWLATTTIAPIMCFTSHIGYMILGWIANPSHGGAVFIIYTVTFFYFYASFQQIYRLFEDKYVIKDDTPTPGGRTAPAGDAAPTPGGQTDTTEGGTVRNVEMKNLATAEKEYENREFLKEQDYIKNEYTFSFVGLLTTFLLGIPILLIHGYIIVAFGTLPIVGVIEDTPKYLLSLFQISVLVASVVLTYKFLTADPPVERDLLRGIIQNVQYYRHRPLPDGENNLQPRWATEVEKAAAVYGALMYNNLVKDFDDVIEQKPVQQQPPKEVPKQVTVLDLKFLDNKSNPDTGSTDSGSP